LQDDELTRLVQIYGDQSWHRLCKFMPNKTEIRCFKRWLFLSKGQEEEVESVSDVPATSSQWTAEEDELLRSKVDQFGT
jgi:hypothetical protein